MKERPLRVGLFTPNYPGLTGDGGIGTYTQNLAQGLVELGHHAVVLTPWNDGPRPTAFDGPVPVHFTSTMHFKGVDRLRPGTGAEWRVWRAAKNLVREHQLDAFEFPNWEGYGLMFARLARTPTLVRLHTSAAEMIRIDGLTPNRWDRFNVWRETTLAHGATRVVTHSEAHRAAMAAENGLALDAIRLVPHGVRVAREFVRPPRQPGPLRVVYLGRLEHRKGTPELLQAIPRVLQAVPDVDFTLIGADRPHAPGGRTHADYLATDFPAEVRRRITLAGVMPQPEVDAQLQRADLFVAPSRYESFGLIFLEAMRWGTPVLGTTAGGIPEIIKHTKSGWLVPPADSEGLAAGITTLLQNAALREELGAAGRQRVETQFTVEQMARRMAALYTEIIPPRRPKPS